MAQRHKDHNETKNPELWKDWEYKDRQYQLLRNKGAKRVYIQSRHSATRPLEFWDESLKMNRKLRFSANHDTPFVDEQTEGTVALKHVKFENGVLYVSKENVGLQRFLHLHTKNGRTFEMVDKVKDAEDELAKIEQERDAVNVAYETDIDRLEAIMRTEIGSKVDDLTSKELLRDAVVFAKKNPKLFLELANDEDIELRNLAVKAVRGGFIKITQDGGQVTHNNGRKIVDVVFEENPYAKLAQYFKTDDGIELMKNLQKKLGVK